MPVSIADFQKVLFAIVTFKDIELSDIEHNALPVSGCDPPLTALALLGDSCHLERW